MLIVFFLENEWARRLLTIVVLIVAYFVASYFIKKRRKGEVESALIPDTYTRLSWNLEKMVLPHSGHGLAESVPAEMSAELILKKDGTFEAKCPLNTFSGKWILQRNGDEPAEDEEVAPAFIVEQTTAALGNEVTLRMEEWFVRMLKNTYDVRVAHADTHLILRAKDDQVIGMFKQKPAERRTFFKK